ncbi:MAG: ATP-grasp fold amidoligase family protein [Erysipelotrichaceae bacterium]
MKKIAFLCPYFGKLPRHCQLWLNSIEKNPNVTWFLITDDKTKFEYPSNVKVFYTTLDELREEYQKKFDFKISLPGVYKLGDYKPLFGYLHEDLIKDYDAWGHIDVADEIYGNIRTFVTDEYLEKYDKLMFMGHMCIYRNTKEVNRRFMLESDIGVNYKTIFSSDKFYNFEEFCPGSITSVYLKNGYEVGRLDNEIADISGISYAFKLGKWSEDFNTIKYYPRVPLVFSWENGRTYGYYIINRKIEKKEYLYVHFKRRKMTVDVPNNAIEYMIVPNGFVSMPQEVNKAFIKMHSKNKIFYDMYFKEKKKALKIKLRKYFVMYKLFKYIARLLPDKLYLKIKYRYILGKKLNLDNPASFNEKIQWMKLYNRKPKYTSLVDKYEVKEIVNNKVGKQICANLIGVYDNFEQIDFTLLPTKFVIKTTHDSGGIVICKDKNTLNKVKASKIINNSLKTDFYKLGREWPYKNVKRRIIIEEYLEDESHEELKDYKIFCFNGKARYIQLDFSRFSNHRRNVYDTNWNLLQIELQYKSDTIQNFEKPERLDEMLKYAELLAEGFPFVRCDFYHLEGKVIFGEMTFFPESGFGKFNPEEWDTKFGELIDFSV